jgi:nicotinic acid mononucleotide adenylyltransferase
MVSLEVIARPGVTLAGARDIDAIDVSATQVRSHTSELIPESVERYIKENNLYVS